MREQVATTNAPGAIGPYSQGIVAEGRLFFSAGQIALDPAGGQLVGDDIQTQTRQALTNLQQVVEAAGSSMQNIVKMTVFLQNMDDFAAMNEIYGEFFQVEPPARSAVQVARLPKDALVEVECIALVS